VTETVEARSHGTPEALTLHAPYLDALTKEQLLRLTGDLDVEGQSTMSKQELNRRRRAWRRSACQRALERGTVSGPRSTGSEMGISMTKSELIATIGTSRAPVAGQERQEG
jgi:hypothetical protein